MGRAAFVADVAVAVGVARGQGTRLSLALVTGDEAMTPAASAGLNEVAGVSAYVVGTRSAAFLLPGCGRAAALGVLARIEVACGLRGRAVELAPGEDATELVARLLTDRPMSD